MATLWVDCDDTLVLWERDAAHPSGLYMGSQWEANAPLVEAVQQWPGKVVVWSGGGKDYAAMWAQRLGIEADETHAKFGPIMKAVAPNDVCVDDQPIQVAGRVVTWQEFVARPV